METKEVKWWARQNSNLRPLPCQGSQGHQFLGTSDENITACAISSGTTVGPKQGDWDQIGTSGFEPFVGSLCSIVACPHLYKNEVTKIRLEEAFASGGMEVYVAPLPVLAHPESLRIPGAHETGLHKALKYSAARFGRAAGWGKPAFERKVCYGKADVYFEESGIAVEIGLCPHERLLAALSGQLVCLVPYLEPAKIYLFRGTVAGRKMLFEWAARDQEGIEALQRRMHANDPIANGRTA